MYIHVHTELLMASLPVETADTCIYITSLTKGWRKREGKLLIGLNYRLDSLASRRGLLRLLYLFLKRQVTNCGSGKWRQRAFLLGPTFKTPAEAAVTVVATFRA